MAVSEPTAESTAFGAEGQASEVEIPKSDAPSLQSEDQSRRSGSHHIPRDCFRDISPVLLLPTRA